MKACAHRVTWHNAQGDHASPDEAYISLRCLDCRAVLPLGPAKLDGDHAAAVAIEVRASSPSRSEPDRRIRRRLARAAHRDAQGAVVIEWRPDSDGNGGRKTPAVYRARVGVFQLHVIDHASVEEPHRHRWTVLVGDKMVEQGDARGEYGAKQAARAAVVRIIALAERQLYRKTRVETCQRRRRA